VGIALGDGSTAIRSGNTVELGAAGNGGEREDTDPETWGADGVRAAAYDLDAGEPVD
jgi:hypothetical protein